MGSAHLRNEVGVTRSVKQATSLLLYTIIITYAVLREVAA